MFSGNTAVAVSKGFSAEDVSIDIILPDSVVLRLFNLERGRILGDFILNLGFLVPDMLSPHISPRRNNRPREFRTQNRNTRNKPFRIVLHPLCA